MEFVICNGAVSDCVCSYLETSSYITVQRHFRIHYGLGDIQAPSNNLIKYWVYNFKQSDSILKVKPTGRSRTVRIPTNVDRMLQFLQRALLVVFLG